MFLLSRALSDLDHGVVSEAVVTHRVRIRGGAFAMKLQQGKDSVNLKDAFFRALHPVKQFCLGHEPSFRRQGQCYDAPCIASC